MSLLDLAEDAVYERMVADGPLTTAVGHSGSDRRIKHGWPQSVLAEPASDAFPLVTYFAPSEQKVHTGRGTVRIDVQMFAWPDGSEGGPAKLKAIDDALEALFDEVSWTHDGTPFYAMPTEARRMPGSGPRVPMGRVRSLRVGVN